MKQAIQGLAGYNRTIIGCFVGFIVQAIVNNFAPLLFLTFQSSYGIPLSQITVLVTVNFGVQLLVDAAAISFVDRIGYRTSMILAHVMAAAGLVALTILPDAVGDPFIGFLLAVIIYAIGGGLLEVLVSPVMESCPTPNKEKAMSLLHSFYCWGYVAVVAVSTLFFSLVGIGNWKILALIWAVIPVANAIVFVRAPIAPLIDDSQQPMAPRVLFKQRFFWILVVMMVCAGASEQSVSQWASTFAETGLGVSKSVGDLAGPMSFAIMMGLARAFYGRFGHRIDLSRFMTVSAALCVGAYLLIVFVPVPAIGLLGCALTGCAVGIMWPGTFSQAAAAIKGGGTAMFALLALAGDLGCSAGPTLVGLVSSQFGDNLKTGVLAAIVFPLVLLMALRFAKPHRGISKSGACLGL
ncbi:MAG: MFS transporter [Propionibacteriaceae bacterium]|nr:MFS transporter [Propionibacteriaceae bacterium]